MKTTINKKGMSTELLVFLILGIVAFALIVGFIMKTNQGAEGKVAEIACYDSVSKRVALATRGGEETWYPLLCSTQDKEIEGDAKEITLQLANLMARCWWMLHEGRYEDFVSENVEGRSFLDPVKVFNLERNSQCFICYSALIQDEEIEGDTNGQISPQEMIDFLLSEDYPQLGIKYVDYFQSYGGPGRIAIAEDIKPQSAYAILYLPQIMNEESLAAGVQRFFVEAADFLGIYNKDDQQSRSTSLIAIDTLSRAQANCIADLSEQISEVSS